MRTAQFDDLLRSFASAASRRGILAGLAGGLLAVLLPASTGEEAVAACQERCGRCERCRNGTCRPRRDRTRCSDTGRRQCCAGTCCARGNICVGGECVNGRFAVSIIDNEFVPPELAIPVGATVTWTHKGTHSHSVTADDGSFGTGRMRPGERFRRIFETPGSVPYHCNFHKLMTATIEVT